MADSIGIAADCKTGKPQKPYADFPLYAHATKRWAKKIKGRTHFFGPWADWQAAYARYQHEMPYLLAGKTPPPKESTALTVGNMVNGMLEQKEAEVKTGELAARTWLDYKRTGEILVAEFGRHTTVESLQPADFAALRTKLSKTLGLVALGNEIGRCRVFFNWAFKSELIDRPVRCGVAFKKPSKKSVRTARQAKPKKLFTLDELRTLYHAANPQMKAFMLLAINGGMGNGDIARLEPRHIVDGWIVFPRPKTSVERRFPLWPETVAALAKIKRRESTLPYVFVTKYGECWHKDDKDSPLSKEFRKHCLACDCHKLGRGFYSLRHQFRTVADGCLDRTAVDFVMGHDDGSMARNYTQDVEDERLQKVVDHVREWVKPMFKAVRPRKAK